MSEKFHTIKGEIISYVKNNKTQAVKAAILAILFVIAACLFFAGNDDESDTIIIDTGEQSIASEEIEPEAAANIYIDVGGAVNMPGVVSLPPGSRVFEAISAVGGVTKEGNTSNLNLASILADGDKIYVSNVDEKNDMLQNGGSFFSSTPTGTSTGKINLNRASSEQLQLLQGVGPAMAERIIEYRNSVGMFKTTKDLMNVSGIGEKTFKKLEGQLEV